jgi:hypothetical protein
MSQNGN